MIRIPTNRTPTHPGEMLLEEFVRPLNVTTSSLAAAMHLPETWIDELVNGQRSITPSLALRLAKLLGMSPDFWMNLQVRWDLYRAQQEERSELDRIQPLQTTPTP
jgi:addiction module HigA family antidote